MNIKSQTLILALIILFQACEQKSIAPNAETGTISGFVHDIDQDTVINNAYLSLQPDTITTLSDLSGKFLFQDVEIGEYTLNVSKPLYIPQSAKIIVLEDDTTKVLFSLSAVKSAIVGQIIDELSLTPVSDVTITTEPVSDEVLTDSMGNYLIYYLEPGEYKIIASKKGYIDNDTTLTIIRGDTLRADLTIYKIPELVFELIGLENIPVFSLETTSIGNLVATTEEGIFYSDMSWTDWSKSDLDLKMEKVIANPVSGELYTYCTRTRNLFTSDDNGTTWRLYEELPDTALKISCMGIRGDGNIYLGLADYAIHVAGDDVYPVNKIFLSIDFGNSWEELYSALQRYIIIEFDSNNRMYLGRFADPSYLTCIESDGHIGHSQFMDGWINDIAFNQYGHIFVTSNGGLFRSYNNLESVKQIHTERFYTVVCNSRNHVFAGYSSGTYRSLNFGDQPRDSFGFGLGVIYTLIHDAHEYLIAGTLKGVYRTTTPSIGE